MKSDRTKLMEAILRKALEENEFENIKMEHSISGGRIDCYAEYRGKSIGIEIKQDRSDLLVSRNGKNFVFDYNYLFVPDELIYAALQYTETNCDGLGILSFSKIDVHRSSYSHLFCAKYPNELCALIKEGPWFYPQKQQIIKPLGESWYKFLF